MRPTPAPDRVRPGDPSTGEVRGRPRGSGWGAIRAAAGRFGLPAAVASLLVGLLPATALAQGAEPDEDPPPAESPPAAAAPAPAPRSGGAPGTCLSGDCSQGYGVLVVSGGMRYEGHFSGGLPDGYGVMYSEKSPDPVVGAGTFEGGLPKNIPKDPSKVALAGSAAAALRAHLPAVLDAAPSGFQHLRGDPVAAERWKARVGQGLDPDATVWSRSWYGLVDRDASVVGATIRAAMWCAALAAELGRWGGPWRTPDGASRFDGCDLEATGGPWTGARVQVHALAHEGAEFQVTLAVHPPRPR